MSFQFDGILAIDTESCDGRVDNGSLCSLGFCRADADFNILERADILFNPLPKRFFVGKGGKSGIWFAYPESAFRRAPRFSELYAGVAKLFQGNVLVIGHALRNDLHYLDSACRSFGLPSLRFTYLDSELLYKLYRDEPCSTGLKAACETFSLEFSEHRSDEDAYASLMLTRSICRAEGKSLRQLIEEWQITLGTYEDFTATACFTDRVIGGVAAFVPTSVNSRKLLVLDAQDRYLADPAAPDNPFKGKRVWLESELKYRDAVLTRRIFERLSGLGAQLSGMWHCDVAVCRSRPGKVDAADARERSPLFKKGVRCLTLDEFLGELGTLPATEYDDVSALRELKRVLFSRGEGRIASLRKREQADGEQHSPISTTSR